MRISDWSSDVCSSDLGVAGQQVLAVAAVDDVIAGRGSRKALAGVERRRRGGLVVGLGNTGLAGRERIAGDGVLAVAAADQELVQACDDTADHAAGVEPEASQDLVVGMAAADAGTEDAAEDRVQPVVA